MSEERTIFPCSNEPEEQSTFLPSGMPLYGLPTNAAQVEDSDSPSLVYRAFTIGGSSAALLRTAATIESIKNSSSEFVIPKLVDQKTHARPSPPLLIRYVDTDRPLSLTHILIPLSDGEVLQSIDQFLTDMGISSEKRHPQSNIYHCHTVVDCSVTRFDIRLVPSQAAQGVNVEFRRSGGSTECFSKIYKQFKERVGCDVSTRSSSPISPFAHRLEGDELDDADYAEIEKALAAMALWIARDPLEALQCVGQFYIVKNRHVVESMEILYAICRIIETHQDLTDANSVLTSTVAMSCVRQFMACSCELRGCNDISLKHINIIAPGIAKAAMCGDLTARREAVSLLMELNPRFGTHIRQGAIIA